MESIYVVPAGAVQRILDDLDLFYEEEATKALMMQAAKIMNSKRTRSAVKAFFDEAILADQLKAKDEVEFARLCTYYGVKVRNESCAA